MIKITILLVSAVARNSMSFNLDFHRGCCGYMHVCYYNIIKLIIKLIKLCVCRVYKPF